MMIPVITIDGPSGAGKGTLCRLVAEQTGYALLDSGALYRLTALACNDANVDLMDEYIVAGVAEKLDIAFLPEDDETLVLLSGQDVSKAIRQEAIGLAASKIAAMPKVRLALLERQRSFRKLPGLIADGRDMGTVVFPDASVKIFLTASAQERARRRVEQLKTIGEAKPDYEKILKDIEERDHRDKSRSTAPLVPAEDAIEIDSSSMSIDEVLAAIMKYANI